MTTTAVNYDHDTVAAILAELKRCPEAKRLDSLATVIWVLCLLLDDDRPWLEEPA
jgi:hypothetical protein